MSRARAAAAALLLAGPCVLAFFSGGFFDEARLWAGLCAWALVAVGALTAPGRARGIRDDAARPAGPALRGAAPPVAPGAARPAGAGGPPVVSRAGWAAAAALAGLCAWTALSAGWAPLSGPALADVQRLVLYLGAFLAALLLLPAVPRAVEPALAAGAVVVIGYALSGRLLPGLVHQAASRSAFGRLEQPLTYWNATGLLAALGAVLCVRLAADGTRSMPPRVAGAAAMPLLLCGVVLSFSRGALLATAAGLAAVCLLGPDRGQGRAVVAAVACALPVAAVAVALDGVRALGGDDAARERDGAVAFAVLALATAAAGWWAWRGATERSADVARSGRAPAGGWRPRRGASGRAARGLSVRRVALPAFAALLAVGALALVAGAGARSAAPATGATPARLVSADSYRFGYWKIALGEWADHPLWGGGAGSFRVAWLRERDVPEAAQDAHSLYVETLGELGLVGAALLLGFLAAVATAAVRAPAPAAGAVAALLVWALHAGVDWDWEMPAVTLPALLLAAHVATGAGASPAGVSATAAAG